MVRSAAIVGADTIEVNVEVVLSNGMPGFSIVGMGDIAVQEARERVRAALRGCGFSMPSDKIVANLAPGYVRKTGSGFDLPIAVGLLVASGQIPETIIEEAVFVGELSLDGDVRSVMGMIAYQEYAWKSKKKLICGPMVGFGEGDLLGCLRILRSLADLRKCVFHSPEKGSASETSASFLDFSDIGGNHQAKRALQIAAAGNHGVLMIGPPGSGKTMLASRLPSILPQLNEAEKLQAAKIHSIAGEDVSSILHGIRPFRSPHHSATSAGMVGGGSPLRPGEITLAHNGVLFLDEIAEFKPSVLQMLRKPLEDGEVVLTRADGMVRLPSRFMLIAASNPCPCGYYGDQKKQCTCSTTQISNYQARLGGPLIDRIDMRLDVWRSSFDSVVKAGLGQNSESMKEGVTRARSFAFQRWSQSCDARIPVTVKEMVEACCMTSETEGFLEQMVDAYAMSGRGIMASLRVARTIADMEESMQVRTEHVAEALSLRIREQGK